MIQTICDFCKKEVKYPMITVTVDNLIPLLGEESEREYHFHRECATRLKNRLGQDTESIPSLTKLSDEDLLKLSREVDKEIIRREP